MNFESSDRTLPGKLSLEGFCKVAIVRDWFAPYQQMGGVSHYLAAEICLLRGTLFGTYNCHGSGSQEKALPQLAGSGVNQV